VQTCALPIYLQVERLIEEGLLGDELAHQGFPLRLGMGIREADAVETVLQTAQMVRHSKRLTPVNGNHLVDTVAVDETSIEHRNACVLEGKEFAVQVDDLVRSEERRVGKESRSKV